MVTRVKNSPIGVVYEDGEIVGLKAGKVDVPVVSHTELIGGGARRSIEGPSLSRIRTGSMFWSPSGRYETIANSGDHTTAMQVTLPPWNAIRFHIPNAVTSTISNVQVKFAPTQVPATAGTTQELAPTGASWASARVNNATTFSLTASPASGRVSWTTTDWYAGRPSIDREGFELSALNFRIEIPAAAANRTVYNYASLSGLLNETDNDLGQLWRPRTASVLGVGTLANMSIANSTVDYICHPVVIEIIPKRPGPSVLLLGDSIHDGSGDSNRLGFQKRAAASVGLNVWTQAIGGSTMEAWYRRLKSTLDAGMIPTHCVVPIFSPNDTLNSTMTQLQIDTIRGWYGVILSELRRFNITPIVATGIPTTPGTTFGKDWGPGDSLRRAWNAEIVTLFGSDVIDLDAVMSGVTDADGQVLIGDGLSTDGLHQNAAGVAVMVEPCLVQFERIMKGEI